MAIRRRTKNGSDKPNAVSKSEDSAGAPGRRAKRTDRRQNAAGHLVDDQKALRDLLIATNRYLDRAGTKQPQKTGELSKDLTKFHSSRNIARDIVESIFTAITTVINTLASLESLESHRPPEEFVSEVFNAVTAAAELNDFVQAIIRKKLEDAEAHHGKAAFELLTGPSVKLMRETLSKEHVRLTNNELNDMGFLNSAEAAVKLRVNVSRVRQLVRSGSLECVRSDQGDIWFDPDQLTRFASIERRRGPKPRSAAE